MLELHEDHIKLYLWSIQTNVFPLCKSVSEANALEPNAE